MRATRTARRDGGRLIVGAASFHDRTFEGDEAEGADYSYVGRYRTIPIHLVHVQYYEGDGWILVDPFSGAHVELADIPLLAPDRRTFAAVSDADAYNFHGIQVVEWRRRRFGPVAEVEARYPCDAAWRRRGELALRVLEGESVSEGSAWRPAVVRRSRGAVWRLMPR